MIPLEVNLDIEDNPWTELVHPESSGTLTKIGLLRHGTTKGNAVVAMVVRLPDGRQIIAQTTWALLRMAYAALSASPIVQEEVIE